MNIAFDASAILGPMGKNRGIGNYTLSQFRTMIESDVNNTYYFFNMFEDYSFEEQVATDNVKDFYLFAGREYELLASEEYREVIGDIVKKFIRENEIDIFYITSPFEAKMVAYDKEWFQGVVTVATVYDIIPFVMRDIYLKEKECSENYMQRVEMLRWVDKCLVISQSVKDDMISYLNFSEEKIHVIYAAGDPNVFYKKALPEIQIKEIQKKFHINDKFIMCTGGDDARKNLDALIRAYAKMQADVKKDYQLVIVCKLSKESVEKYNRLIRDLQVESRVILTNFVTKEELVNLYNLAELMVFPSLYEGFGLPIVEAWMCGTPVLTSNNSSLREIGKDAAVLVEADSVFSIANGIENTLLKSDLKELAKKGEERVKLFCWEKVAKNTMQVIKNLEKHPAKERKCNVKKIAMFTPLPPQQSGISDYSVDILSQINSFFEVDVYIDKYETDVEIDRVHIYPFTQFEKKHNEYERIIYQVGNSLFHEYMFPFIKKYPGIVVLHDVNLKEVVTAMCSSEKGYEENLRKYLKEEHNVNEIEQESFMPDGENFEINGFVTNYAKRIIVHSEYAKRRLLEKEVNRDVVVVPLYSLIDKVNNYERSREECGFGNSEVVFGVFGHVHPNKRVLQILPAFAKVHERFPQSKLYFVGKNVLNEAFNYRIKECGIEDSVVVTGYTTLEEFETYMSAVDVCMNLRYPYNGESSASFARLLGKGKCTVVNRIGSFAEVPEDVCVMIDSVEIMNEQEEVEQICQAMLYAMDEDNRSRIENSAKQYAEEVLDLHKIGRKYIQIINEPYREQRHLTDAFIKKVSERFILHGKYDDNQIRELAKTLAYSLYS